MLTRRQALTRATDQLSMHPALRPTALSDAALLLMHLLALDRAALIAHPEVPLDREQQAAYQALLERRLRFEPMQYILGTQEFFGLTLSVSPAVLIPRPETEVLVEAVLARLAHDQILRIVDIGTGSGAIALALAHSLPLAFVTATDLSPAALAVALNNALHYHLAARITFLVSDLLSAVECEAGFDAIVSNPPYIADVDRASLHPQVSEHEPAMALFAGPDGMQIYQRLIPEAQRGLKSGGLLALEIGFGQQQAIAALLAQGWRDVEFVADLQGIPRVALARKR